MARRTRSIVALAVSAGVAVSTMVAVTPAAAVAPPGKIDGYSAEIRRTSYGVPHIQAADYASAGFGSGYVQAEDNVCIIAERVVTANGTRAQDLAVTSTNVQSDLFFRNVIASGAVERLLEGTRDGIDAPSQDARDLIRGFVAGYNRIVRTRETDDPACAGKPWVRQISETDVWRMQYASMVRASSRALQGGILAANPPATASAARSAGAAAAVVSATDGTSAGIGSNAYGLGREATLSGAGMVLANPHFPWDGPERFYRLHITIPGKYDVEGATLVGDPMVEIGHNMTLGWSHTVSTARRFVWHRLALVVGDPTSYYVDGQPLKMTSRTVTVAGQSKTFWETKFGPVVVVPGQFGWTTSSAYAITDINATNNRAIDGWLAMGRASTVRELKTALDTHQHLPWVNVIAADSTGEAMYGDHSVVPRVTNALAASCIPAPFLPTYAATGQAVLDGSRSACDLGGDPDAAVPGILGPANLPVLFRDDHVSNMNDSYWLANPEQPLNGYPRIIGDENRQRSLRTRLGILKIEERLAGTDGLPGQGFTTETLWRSMFDNRVYGGELLRDQLVAACRATPSVTATNGTVVDLTAACDSLAGWDLKTNLDSRGAHVFREFVLAGGIRFADAYSPADPVGTPKVLAVGDARVLRSLGDAVLRLTGIPFNAPLGTIQNEPRGAERIPIHGGRGETGTFNVITNGLVPGVGYPKVTHGSSFVMAVELRQDGPTGRQILTYSQSANPNSPYYADQTRLYSQKGWDTIKYTDAQIQADPALRTYRVGEDEADCRKNGWRAFTTLGFSSQGECVSYFQRARP